MKSSPPGLIFALVLSAYAITFAAAALSRPQEVLTDKAVANAGVPGRNHAYYTQVEKNDQLFLVRELVVYPDRPAVNEHVFVYLNGWIREHLPGLEDATLKLSSACPDYFEVEQKITDWQMPVVRHGHDYGGPLKFWANELLFDQKMILFSPPYDPAEWNCSVEATARLPEPDSRVIFSYAQNFTLQWPPQHDDGLADNS